VIRRFLTILGTVSFLALLLVGCGGSSGENSETKVETAPPAGKLVRTVGRRFVVSDLQGRELRRIALPRGEAARSPVFSANGDELWFLTVKGAAGRERYRLHIYPASASARGNSSPVALDGLATKALRVSPDGGRVAVGISPSTGCGARGVVLGRNGEQTAELQLSEPGRVTVEVLSWSRDGSRLLYSLRRDPHCGKYSLYPAALPIHRPGTGRDRLLTAPRDVTFASSAWSPDDSRIALMECKNEEDWSCRLVIIDANGQGRRVLGSLGLVSGGQLVWAVATNEIVTLRQTDPYGEEKAQVWAFNADSGAGRKVADSGSTEGASADGSLIAGINGVVDVETGQRWPFPGNVERRTPLGTRYLVGPDAYFLEDPKKE
jgi:Tol biopolymer transport system component